MIVERVYRVKGTQLIGKLCCDVRVGEMLTIGSHVVRLHAIESFGKLHQSAKAGEGIVLLFSNANFEIPVGTEIMKEVEGESGVAAVAHTDNWDVLLGDDLEIQIQTRAVTFQFQLLSFEILKEIKRFCQKEIDVVTHIGFYGKTNLHLFWDEEYPDKTRAFLKAYRVVSPQTEHLLEFTFESESLVDLESCVDQLLVDLADD